jgi:ATP-dependent protease ClpP protease subunit
MQQQTSTEQENFLSALLGESNKNTKNSFDYYFDTQVGKDSVYNLIKHIQELKTYMCELKLKNKGIENCTYEHMRLHIKSPGGSLMHVLDLVDLIEKINDDVNCPLKIDTYIEGFAASAATLISVVGKRRYITKSSMMLIHQLSTVTWGKFSEIEEEVQNCTKLMSVIKRIYMTHTSFTTENLDALLRQDKYLSSAEALSFGLVDEIYGAENPTYHPTNPHYNSGNTNTNKQFQSE